MGPRPSPAEFVSVRWSERDLDTGVPFLGPSCLCSRRVGALQSCHVPPVADIAQLLRC